MSLPKKKKSKKADNDIFFCSGEKRRQARHFGIGFIKKDPLVISQSQILHPPSPQNFSGQIVWKLGAKLEVPTGARLNSTDLAMQLTLPRATIFGAPV